MVKPAEVENGLAVAEVGDAVEHALPTQGALVFRKGALVRCLRLFGVAVKLDEFGSELGDHVLMSGKRAQRRDCCEVVGACALDLYFKFALDGELGLHHLDGVRRVGCALVRRVRQRDDLFGSASVCAIVRNVMSSTIVAEMLCMAQGWLGLLPRCTQR